MVKTSYRVTDPATLRALAHPLRQRILMELTVRRSLRAADLADILGEPANAVSYHLRALAKADLLVEAPELARDSRDRVWTLTHPEGVYVPADVGDAGDDVFTDQFLTWVGDLLMERVPKDPRASRGRYVGAALLTKDESHQLFMELAEVLERWREHGMNASAANPHNPNRVFHYTAALVGNRAEDSVLHGNPDDAEEPPTSSVS
ncbi:MAG: helix-turn-helix domain-containing protein [Terrimesophilobacter sp.]